MKHSEKASATAPDPIAKAIAAAAPNAELGKPESFAVEGQSPFDADEQATPKEIEYDYTPTAAEDAPLPDWVVVPQDLTLPRGRTIGYMRFRAKWTDRPDLGDRQCILWNLTAADEKLAISRARGDSMRVFSEMGKQMVRAIDGVKVDWSGKLGPGNVQTFWDEIGTKCRAQIQNYYAKMHTLSMEDQADFFASCIDIRTAT